MIFNIILTITGIILIVVFGLRTLNGFGLEFVTKIPVPFLGEFSTPEKIKQPLVSIELENFSPRTVQDREGKTIIDGYNAGVIVQNLGTLPVTILSYEIKASNMVSLTKTNLSNGLVFPGQKVRGVINLGFTKLFANGQPASPIMVRVEFTNSDEAGKKCLERRYLYDFSNKILTSTSLPLLCK